jgi:hypothetical protein
MYYPTLVCQPSTFSMGNTALYLKNAQLYYIILKIHCNFIKFGVPLLLSNTQIANPGFASQGYMPSTVAFLIEDPRFFCPAPDYLPLIIQLHISNKLYIQCTVAFIEEDPLFLYPAHPWLVCLQPCS